MKKLDLHGIKHRNASNIADTFIRQNKNNLPVEIITGNSLDMQNIIKRIVKSYGMRMKPKSHINLGSYIINNTDNLIN